MGDMADYFQEQDEARLEDGVGFDAEPSPDEQGDYETDKKASRAFAKAKATPEEVASIPIIPSPDELDEILLEFGGYVPGAENNFDKALSAINSLTLKQVLSLIPDEDVPTSPNEMALAIIRNALRAEQRKSAERIWGLK